MEVGSKTPPRCTACDGAGWICCYNTEEYEHEIQRCGSCQAFETDDAAVLQLVEDYKRIRDLMAPGFEFDAVARGMSRGNLLDERAALIAMRGRDRKMIARLREIVQGYLDGQPDGDCSCDRDVGAVCLNCEAEAAIDEASR